MVRLKGPKLAGDELRAKARRSAERKERGAVGAFNRRSRGRLLQWLGSIDRRALQLLPLFVTLTYPATWPDDPATWKRHLEAFAKRVRRRYPGAAIVWRLEPQRRGAPHFHLLVFGVRYLDPRGEVAAWWNAILDGGADHLAAGTRVERVQSWRGVMHYASKYLAKHGDGEGFEGVGRHWGVIGREALPVNWRVYLVPFFEVRRVLRSLRRSNGAKRVRLVDPYAGLWCFLDWETGVRLAGFYPPD